MDINILLALQEFRNGVGGFLADFMLKMTFFGELNTVIIIMAIVYWCVSKKYGTYLLMGWSGNRLVNGFLKITFCAYRPWIRDPRIVPYGDSMTTATGYSFPSGHSMNGATIFGGAIVRKDMPTVLRVVSGVFLALIAFSRIFLGVHTPQDILVGAGAGILVMCLVYMLMQWVSGGQNRDIIVLIVGVILAAALAVYAKVKVYPEDYDAAGKLIVDGAKMANDTFKGVGYCCGFLVGWVFERRFVGFFTDIPMIQRVTRVVLGLLGYYVITLILITLIKTWLSGPAASVLTCFLQVFYVTFLYPLIMKRIE